ncbi:fungal-specific transcription factor domain-containing protein [Dactylonectria estremocensis]|uniref:Fungal-specific transcription factor domain-containing protein n=1 Tax=Dactylonectria estremocensis TaxID=1079267 RepID=A0A9P9ENN1_9HYPO|nr:fungal-specific transcription factor domain-containing protein [Dactylonectria estremocensis]
MNEPTHAPPVIQRTRVACKACHARRVKCDAADGLPCMHCRTRHTACELIESRRGKYTRQQSSKPRRRSGRGRSSQAANPPSHSASPPHSTISVQDDEATTEIPTPQAPVAESPTAQTAAVARPSNPGSVLTLSSVLQMVHRIKEGDSGSLNVPAQGLAPLTDKVHLPSNTELHQSVSLQDALAMPERHVSDQLIRSFFEHFHPAYPVVDRLSFITLYKQDRASPILLHTMYLMALTCGPESLVRIAGYDDRTTARKAHYLRAKALYDADHETDATCLAAALHLLGFWWLGPNDQKDSWYWHGCAVTLAQSIGMHRSLAQRGMTPRLMSIWRRIWWSIYIRDRHGAAALDRPPRIRDEDCDIESANENDLLVDLTIDNDLLPEQKPHHISYFLQLAKLSAILGNIVIGEFSPRRPALDQFDPHACSQSLRSWHSELPQMLRHDSSDKPCGAAFWANMLDVSYQSAAILLFRPKRTGSQTFPEAERDARARTAADAITRAAEDLLANETIHCAHLHIVPSLFAALSIHTLAMGTTNTIQRQLAENKSRQCILALGELTKVWPVGMWVVKSFSNLLRRLLSRGSLSDQTLQVRTSSEEELDRGGGSAITVHADVLGQRLPPVLQPQSITGLHFGIPSLASNQAGGLSTAPLFQSHAYPDHFFGAADQLAYDSTWFGCLENMMDIELLQQELAIGTYSLPHVFGS